MATNKMRPIHPGEILREEFLAPLEMSANALAMELHVPAPRINDVVRERRAVTPDTALRLARFFQIIGVGPRFSSRPRFSSPLLHSFSGQGIDPTQQA